MAVCEYCNQEMRDPAANSCPANTEIEFPDGSALPVVPYDEQEWRCHDCNIEKGGFHHPGCDMERCPRCDGQLITCDCLDDGTEE
jgi:hypothetical protein